MLAEQFQFPSHEERRAVGERFETDPHRLDDTAEGGLGEWS
jgi:hypothetical protein